jgi:hypothetical protein
LAGAQATDVISGEGTERPAGRESTHSEDPFFVVGGQVPARIIKAQKLHAEENIGKTNLNNF